MQVSKLRLHNDWDSPAQQVLGDVPITKVTVPSVMVHEIVRRFSTVAWQGMGLLKHAKAVLPGGAARHAIPLVPVACAVLSSALQTHLLGQ